MPSKLRKNEPGGHPIQVVARRTGLGADVIRVWERRYRAVTPTRDAAGRRLYADADIERLLLLRRATEAGRRIGDVAHLERAELARLVAEDAAHPAASGAPRGAGRSEPAEQYLQACRAAVEQVSAKDLESALQRAAVALSLPVLLDNVVLPLVREIGERCRTGSLRISHEHAATAVLRTFLAQLAGAYRPATRAPVLVVATPAGQRHELGALMAAISAAAEGWRVVYLGPDLPAEEIAHAALEVRAVAVALSLVYPPDDPGVAAELRRLRAALTADATLFVGGRSAGDYGSVLEEIEAEAPADLYDFRRRLEALRRRR